MEPKAIIYFEMGIMVTLIELDGVGAGGGI
jgi:hypothetical protein